MLETNLNSGSILADVARGCSSKKLIDPIGVELREELLPELYAY
jgi:hypothetical protein